jgi:hypothetical protein
MDLRGIKITFPSAGPTQSSTLTSKLDSWLQSAILRDPVLGEIKTHRNQLDSEAQGGIAELVIVGITEGTVVGTVAAITHLLTEPTGKVLLRQIAAWWLSNGQPELVAKSLDGEDLKIETELKKNID